MNHFGKRVVYDGYTFDSAKERDFYLKFIKPSGLRFEVHPNFKIIDKFMVGGTYVRGVWYKPDFVVYDHDGETEEQAITRGLELAKAIDDDGIWIEYGNALIEVAAVTYAVKVNEEEEH